MRLTPQEQKVLDYIRNNRGCTTHDITAYTFVQKPCARITDLRKKGIKIISIGQQKYPGTRAFEKYALGEPVTKTVSQFVFNPATGGMVEHKVQVPV